jgi:uncharacterized membrane protein
MSDLEYEYLLTVKKLDNIIKQKEQKKDEDLLLNKNSEDVIIDNIKEKKKIKADIKTKSNIREDDLYQEIYGKFNGNYDELVDNYVQTLIKVENSRIKGAYFFGFIFCIVSFSLVLLFSNFIPF